MRAILLLLPCLLAACAVTPPVCAPQGAWVSPSSLRPVADPVPGAARHKVVLLGEQHDRPEDHRFELTTIQRLYAADPDMALGFEMFPRSAQAVLGQWVQGRLSEAQFLDRANWKTFWGFDPAFYLPIFRFARDHRIPIVALNVSRHLVHLTAQTGWDSVPAADREGVGKPAPPTEAYRASLAEAMAGHGGPAMTPARLSHFIEAQSVWDRAMAEGIAGALARPPGRHMVAIMGAGHLENRDGVPHQLAALGVADVVVLLPGHAICKPENPGYADALYID
jgi:uncharacterized iron-regulated protein